MSKGSARRGRLVMMRYYANTNQSTSRCAIIVSKKVLKSAVKRNRARRRIYNIVRHNIQSLQMPTDIVFVVVSPEIITISPADLAVELSKLLSAVGNRSDDRPQTPVI